MNPTLSMKTNPSVDGYLRKHKQWRQPLEKLRTIILDCPLIEEIKWRVPCYTFQGHNVVFLGAFKDCCTLSFVKGALLKDDRRILELPGPNTQSARVLRFTRVDQIVELEPDLNAYINQAVELERVGAKVAFKKITERPAPEEFQTRLDEMPPLKAAFEALTPGRRRAYFLHFSAPRQSKTRISRIEKCLPRILDGRGMND